MQFHLHDYGQAKSIGQKHGFKPAILQQLLGHEFYYQKVKNGLKFLILCWINGLLHLSLPTEAELQEAVFPRGYIPVEQDPLMFCFCKHLSLWPSTCHGYKRFLKSPSSLPHLHHPFISALCWDFSFISSSFIPSVTFKELQPESVSPAPVILYHKRSYINEVHYYYILP